MIASLTAPDSVAVAGRTEDFDFEIFRSDGATPEGIAADDVVRFKLADTPGGIPLLDIISSGATPNGSRVYIDDIGVAESSPAAGHVRLAQADTQGMSGKKYFEMDLVDNSETVPADAIKMFLRGVIVFWPSQSGNLGLTP